MKTNIWYLMSIEEIAMLRINNNGLYRRQKSYYKKTGNSVMLGRMEEVEKIHQKGTILES